jgi:hypothetical protein
MTREEFINMIRRQKISYENREWSNSADVPNHGNEVFESSERAFLASLGQGPQGLLATYVPDPQNSEVVERSEKAYFESLYPEPLPPFPKSPVKRTIPTIAASCPEPESHDDSQVEDELDTPSSSD